MNNIKAIIGEHASGKTTLAKCLAQRFTNPISISNSNLADDLLMSYFKNEQVDCLIIHEADNVALRVLSERIKNNELQKNLEVIIVSNSLSAEVILRKFKEIGIEFVAIITCYRNSPYHN